MLTETQMDALRWIDRFPIQKLRWMRDGKDAFGPPDKWDAIELSGARGSIVIEMADWDVIRPLKDFAERGTGPSPYVLNDAGRAALAG